jgi:hypothetical protein
MTFKRIFGEDVMSIRDDGRTIEGRIVPYDEIAHVVDIHPIRGKLERYPEQFLAHSFSNAVQYAQRRGNAGFISLNLEHNETIESRIGYAAELDERDDGVYAIFRLYEGRDIEKHRSMLRESHTGLSVKFADVKPPKMLEDVVSHVQVILEHVAATPLPAYASAEILAMRGSDNDDQVTTQMEITRPNLENVREWLASMRQT